MRPRLRRLGLVALAALAGCSYYNGMYNANRLARAAEKAQREGRTFDAQSYWGQAAVKAESVIVRQPTSKWVDDALLLRGRALMQLGQCRDAVKPLTEARMRLTEPHQLEQATFFLAHCRLQAGDTVAAGETFAMLLHSADPERRREAHYQVGRARLLREDWAGALAAVDSLDDWRASGVRMIALAGLNRRPAAEVVADSLIARGDTTAAWNTMLAVLGRRDPRAATALVNRLRTMPGASPALQARWLTDDALRLAERDPAAAEARLAEAAALGGREDEVARTRLALARLRLAQVAAPEGLAPVLAELDSIAHDEHGAGPAAQVLAATARRVAGVADSAQADAPRADLALFLAGEAARDSLQAPRLALDLFRRVVTGWPESPYAPKALLAGRQLDTAFAQATQPLVDGRYSTSPYVTALRGEQSPEFRALEDSLRAFAVARAATAADAAREAAARREAPRTGPGVREVRDSLPPRDRLRDRERPQPSRGGTKRPGVE
ncbi:MAG TPA: hypothetical protein VFS40_03335 [Gemmatimonadales bacterium]|nr:hypothetical protein [Gemmatimonadales bacterium]